MTLTKRINLKMLKKIHYNVMRRRLQLDIEKKMDDAIEEGDIDKVLEIKFLRDRL